MAFKDAGCLTVVKEVQAKLEPVIGEERGAPVVKIVPAEPEKNNIFGCLTGKVKIVGDIESPIPVEWEITKK